MKSATITWIDTANKSDLENLNDTADMSDERRIDSPSPAMSPQPSEMPKVHLQQSTITAETPSPIVYSPALQQPSSCRLAGLPRDISTAILNFELTEFHHKLCEKLEYVWAQQKAREHVKAGMSKSGTVSRVRDFTPTKHTYPGPSLKRCHSSASPSPPSLRQKAKDGYVRNPIPPEDSDQVYVPLDGDFSWWTVPGCSSIPPKGAS